MTYKNGFIAGLVPGFVAWAFVYGYIIYTPAPTMVARLLSTIAGILFIIAVLMAFISAWRRSSFLGSTLDGFIYGFVGIFDLLYVLSQLAAGYLPIP